LVCAQKIKGLKNPFQKSTQPPAKITQNQQQINGHNPRVDLCPKSIKKSKKIEDFGEMGFRVFWGQNGKSGILGGRRWVGMVENGRRWCSVVGEVDGWRWVGLILDLGRRGTEEVLGVCTAGWEKWGRGGEM
jgi:hypothetical protein